MNQEKKDKIAWITFLIGGFGLGVANLYFMFYCIGFFLNSKFGYGTAVPGILLYIFANAAIIFIVTEIINWSDGDE